MLRCHSGKYRAGFCRCFQFLIAHFIQFCPCDSAVSFLVDAQFPADGFCRQYMVSCNHDRTDACLSAKMYRLFHFRSGRVYHACHARKNQIPLQSFFCQRGFFRPLPKCHCYHSKCLSSHFPIDHPCHAFPPAVKRNLSTALHAEGTFSQQNIRCAFCDGNPAILCLMEGGHALSRRRKRNFSHPWHVPPEGGKVNAHALCVLSKGFFRRFSLQIPIGHIAVVAEGKKICHCFPQVLILRFPMTVICPCGDLHTVLGQCACFVRANDLCAAQCFHCRQPPDNGMFFRHTGCAHSQHNGHNGRQSFRNGCHRQAHCRHKHGKRRFLLQNPHAENEGANCQCTNTQLFPCLFQFLLQRCHTVRCMGKHGGNSAHFRFHTRCCHQHFPFAVNHITSSEHHIFPVTCCRFFRQAAY